MSRKVLVVDDEKLIVKGLRFSLEQDGMEVDCAYDGEEAVEKAKENKYDIILLDLMLPKMDGLEVCQPEKKLYKLNIDYHLILSLYKNFIFFLPHTELPVSDKFFYIFHSEYILSCSGFPPDLLPSDMLLHIIHSERIFLHLLDSKKQKLC